jgi:hypothetical protein
MCAAVIPETRTRRKRNGARKILPRSRERLLSAIAPENVGQSSQQGDYRSDPGWPDAARQYQATRGHRTLLTPTSANPELTVSDTSFMNTTAPTSGQPESTCPPMGDGSGS